MRASSSPDRRGSVPAIVAAAVVAAVVVAGALWLVAAPEAASQPVGADAADRYAAVDGVTATETTVLERGDRTTRTVAEVAFRPGADHRRETVLAGGGRYDVTVTNGSAMWLYDRDRGLAKRVPLSGPPDRGRSRADRVERLFAALDVTRRSASASAAGPSIAPLPVVPRSDGGPAGAANASLGVRYDGTATVGDREAYVLRVAPRAEDAAYEQTLWVDTEHFLVLRQHTEWVDGDTPVAVTTTYTNVTVDPGLGDGAFAFDPPANVTVERVDAPETTAYDSAAALREATNVSVPSPSLPASFRLTYASETTGDVHGVGLRYADETGRITVAKYNRPFPVDGDRAVTVAGREAAVSYGPTTSVSWNCGDYRYTVRGQRVSASALVEVARSVGCE